MGDFMEERVWFTTKDAALYLGTSKDFIRDLILDGLPCYKVRHMIFVKREELDEYIIKHRIV